MIAILIGVGIMTLFGATMILLGSAPVETPARKDIDLKQIFALDSGEAYGSAIFPGRIQPKRAASRDTPSMD